MCLSLAPQGPPSLIHLSNSDQLRRCRALPAALLLLFSCFAKGYFQSKVAEKLKYLRQQKLDLDFGPLEDLEETQTCSL